MPIPIDLTVMPQYAMTRPPTSKQTTMRSLTSSLVLALLTTSVPAQDEDRLTLEKWLDWENVGSPSLSPDGEQIVFSRSWTDKINDRMQSELWIMDKNGANQRFLIKGSSPKWSPDGTRIAYTKSGEPSGNQIHVFWLSDRSSTQITHTEQSPSGILWSPDGKSLSFTMQVPEQVGFKIELPKRPKGAKWAPDPTVITRLQYRRDGSGYAPSGFRHIFVVDATGGTPRQITSGDYNHGGGRWSPDGKTIYFSGLRVEDAQWQRRESEVYSVDVASGEITQITDRPGSDSGPVPSPDGRMLAYTTSPKNEDTYNVSDIQIKNLGGGRYPDRTIAMDRRPSSITWSKDGETLLVTYQDSGERQLWAFAHVL